MGMDYYFCAERRIGDEWLPAHEGDFTWLSRRSAGPWLFLGGPFTMKAGRPPDENRSAFFRLHDESYTTEAQTHWIGLDELMIEEWPHTRYIVQGQIAARHAGSFGDGRHAFPDFDGELRVGAVDVEPINQLFGPAAHLRRTTKPDFLVPVTWSESVEALLGDRAFSAFSAFRSLLELGPADELRVMMCWL